ncbi:hypothetical protein TBC1_11158 [Lentimicrobium saccharophilum]|uniref:Uncharacterized protein n=1 Tax=Lentimicrobium saccharophilum TaxID=1678841 RepID=A0A0S7BW85_9BACT|nr:hypothetical protein [Lentimicrobium saccharophilum]GAP42030.1 hypothetical protein TBC1_11158 [Lentimicrobium saccharophilum]
MNTDKLKPLSAVFALGGVWDTIAGILYIFAIGSGRNIDNPPMDPFYAIFLGSFFLCFAYLQFMSALNIRRYALNVGCLITGRAFYILLLYSYMVFVPGFPDTFWFTGIIDGLLTISYIIFALRGGLGVRNLFLPEVK